MSVNDIVLSAAGAGGAPATYVEDVFSTYLYTGNGTTSNAIVNGIDLAGKGGLVWTKRRDTGSNNALIDTVRGGSSFLASNLTNAAYTGSTYINPFNANGYTISESDGDINASGGTYCSWTFRKQAKFFDIVTYTGNGVDGRSITHNLGSTPGMIIVKCTSSSTNWPVVHRSGDNLALNLTAASGSTAWAGGTLGFNNSTTFETYAYAGSQAAVNASGQTYVAYLFAHNAGGFGTSGTDNAISCGFTTIVSGKASVNLGYEAQYVLIKATNADEGWVLMDVMRGMSMTNTAYLYTNTSSAEGNFPLCYATATGFNLLNLPSGQTYIYMAIRRPMKVPTDATTVFKPVAWTGTGTNPQRNTAGFPVDMFWDAPRVSASGFEVKARLIGTSNYLLPSGTSAESSNARLAVDNNVGVDYGNASGSWWNQSDRIMASHYFRRAPGFFDVVCYTGTGGNLTVNHNLGVAPELMIVKNRTLSGRDWAVYSAPTGATKYLYLNTTDAAATFSYMWNDTAPTSSVFTVGATADVNSLSDKFVAYLFATCPGVSKVGSYTGTGATQTINCGFTGGARFVLIKRTDSTGAWYVWDTARGMVAGTDPSLLLNSTAAEVNANSVYTATTGFQLLASPSADVNTNGGSYIFLAIA